MKYLIVGTPLDVIKRLPSAATAQKVTFAVAMNDTIEDFVSVKDIVADAEIQSFLEDDGVTFDWKIWLLRSISAKTPVDSKKFYIELQASATPEDYSIIDIGLNWITQDSGKTQKLLTDAGFSEETSNNITKACNTTLDAIINGTENNELLLCKGYTGIVFPDQNLLEDTKKVWDNYIKIQLPVCTFQKMQTPTDNVSFPVPSYKRLRTVYKTQAEQALEMQNNIAGDTDISADLDVNADVSSTANSDASDAQDTGDTVISDDADDMIGDVQLSYEDIGPVLSKHVVAVNSIFPYYDSIDFEAAILKYGNCDKLDIAGHPENNTLGIQPNEEKYYKALCSLVNEGMRKEYSIISKQAIQDCIKDGKHSEIVDDYLRDLALQCFRLNYRHTGCVGFGLTEQDPDSNTDSYSAQDAQAIGYKVAGFYTIEYSKSALDKNVDSKGFVRHNFTKDEYKARKNLGKNFSDAFPTIEKYVHNFAFKSPYAWVDAAIRLLRWGKRKPSSLFVPSDGNKTFLTLDMFQLTEFSGTIADLVPFKDPTTGASLFFESLITVKSVIADNMGCKDVYRFKLPKDLQTKYNFIAGVTLVETYENTEEYSRFECVDIFALHDSVKAGRLNVADIRFNRESGKFETSAEIVANTENSQDLSVINSQLETFTDRVLAYPNTEVLRTLQGAKQLLHVSGKDYNISSYNLFSLFSKLLGSNDIKGNSAIGNLLSLENQQERRNMSASMNNPESKEIITWALINLYAAKYLRLYNILEEIAKEKGVSVIQLPLETVLNTIEVYQSELFLSNGESAKQVNRAVPTETGNKKVQSTSLFETNKTAAEIYRIATDFIRIVDNGKICGFLAMCAVPSKDGRKYMYNLIFAYGDKSKELNAPKTFGARATNMHFLAKLEAAYYKNRLYEATKATSYLVLATSKTFENIHRNSL